MLAGCRLLTRWRRWARRSAGSRPQRPLGLEVTAAARAAAEESLARSGLLLLLGEMHGVTENPLLIGALMADFGLSSLALEWPEGLTPVITASSCSTCRWPARRPCRSGRCPGTRDA